MKKLILTFAALILIAAPASADLLTTKIEVTDGPGNGNGGAFWAEVKIGSIEGIGGVGSKFPTFCIENDEYFSPGNRYWIDVETVARLGGSGGPSPDPLDPVSAALYTQWLNSEDTTNAATATKYQLAIWKVEDEAVWDAKDKRWEKGNGLNQALDGAYNAYDTVTIDTLIASVGSPSSIGNVRVMTLWSNIDKTGVQQDMLVTVPAPAAIGLGMLGLGLIGWYMRRFA